MAKNGFLMSFTRLLRRKSRLILSLLAFVVIGHLSGLFDRFFETSFDSNFKYPLDIPNLEQIIDKKLNGEEIDEIEEINHYNYRFMIRNKNKCSSTHPNDSNTSNKGSDIVIMYMIKSAVDHKDRRDAIRKTWGQEDRFIDVVIKRIFVLGNCGHDNVDKFTCQDSVDNESQQFNDIIQADFVDSYYNNTIKTMMALKWLYQECPGVQHVLFVDDDYYVSPKNLLHYVRNPFEPNYGHDAAYNKLVEYNKIMPDPLIIPKDGRLFAGYVFPNSRPMRHRIMSKWYISVDEYEYDKYPPYVTAGSFVLSNLAFKQLWLASSFVKHFKYDDIYLGLIAKKINLIPKHNTYFYFNKINYKSDQMEDVITSHGYGDPTELVTVYTEMKRRKRA